MLGQTVNRFGWHLFAWVLMSNHYHLVVQTPEPNLSRGMHWLNARYAQSFNRRHNRRGHLFQGRFDGVLVDKESYLLTVIRYVVLNPVRAAMVTGPADYQWSSYRQTAGFDPPDSWLAANGLLESFGGANVRGCQQYVEFVAQSDASDSPWSKLIGQIYLGSADWMDQIAERIASAPRSSEHPRAQRQPVRLELAEIVDVVARVFDSTPDLLRSGEPHGALARTVAAFIAFEDGLHRQSDIALALGIRGRSTVSALIRRCRDALSLTGQLTEIVESCRKQLPHRAAPGVLAVPERAGFYDEPHWFCSMPRKT